MLKIIALAVVGVLAIAVLVGVYFSNRALRVDFWVHHPADSVLPAPTGLYADYLGRYVHDPQTDLGLHFETVEFRAKDREALRGWLVPADGKSTAVVMVHGLGADRRNFLEQVPLFHTLGYTVLLFDCRNHGISGGDGVGPSAGMRESEDVSSAVAFLKDTGGFRKVVAFGMSQGAASSILAAGRDPMIDGVIAAASFEDMAAMIAGAARGRGTSRFGAALAGNVIAWRLGAESDGPLKAVAHIAPRPILLIHGTSDDVIPNQSSKDLYAHAGEPKQLWLVEGATHWTVLSKQPEELAHRVTDFLARYFPQ